MLLGGDSTFVTDDQVGADICGQVKNNYLFKNTGGSQYALSASNRHHSNVCAQSRRHHLPSTRLAIVTSVVGSSRSKDSFSIGRKALIGLVEGARRSEEAPSVR